MAIVGIILALLTIATLGYAALNFYKEHKAKQPISFIQNAPVLPFIARESVDDGITRPISIVKLKGHPFEQYVADRFDPKYFHCKEWRSDVKKEQPFPSTSRNPDLVFELNVRGKLIPFAVECKFRSEFLDDAIYWANSRQIRHYREYEREHHLPVYLVLGVGGKAEQPSELFVVPLIKIPDHIHYLTSRFLGPYAKRPGSSFVLDANRMILE